MPWNGGSHHPSFFSAVSVARKVQPVTGRNFPSKYPRLAVIRSANKTACMPIHTFRKCTVQVICQVLGIGTHKQIRQRLTHVRLHSHHTMHLHRHRHRESYLTYLCRPFGSRSAFASLNSFIRGSLSRFICESRKWNGQIEEPNREADASPIRVLPVRCLHMFSFSWPFWLRPVLPEPYPTIACCSAGFYHGTVLTNSTR